MAKQQASRRGETQQGLRLKLFMILTAVLTLASASVVTWGLAQQRLAVALGGAVAGAILIFLLLLLALRLLLRRE